jgi:hypothetical protein
MFDDPSSFGIKYSLAYPKASDPLTEDLHCSNQEQVVNSHSWATVIIQLNQDFLFPTYAETKNNNYGYSKTGQLY